MLKIGGESMDKRRDRVRGCLLGVAIGDALGAPFEHLGPGMSNQVLDKTGGRITGFHPWQYPAGSWTDDTGMTLAACRGLLRFSREGGSEEARLQDAFYAWAGSDECRVPGRTVLRASKERTPDVDSWANGALMRTSPIALYAHLKGLTWEEGATLAFSAASLTHGHPLATFPAVEAVLALMSILSGEGVVPERLSDPGRFCRGLERHRHARYPKYLDVRHAPLDSLVPSTGLWMWRHVLERCLGLNEGVGWDRIPPFEEGILKTVNESYDRDTAGAVAGALLGAYWGETGIPGRWTSRVEKRERILTLADELQEIERIDPEQSRPCPETNADRRTAQERSG